MRQKQNTESFKEPLFAGHQGLQFLRKLHGLTAQRRQIATITLTDQTLGIERLRSLDRFCAAECECTLMPSWVEVDGNWSNKLSSAR